MVQHGVSLPVPIHRLLWRKGLPPCAMRAFQPVHPRFEGAPGLENLEDKGVEEAMPKKKSTTINDVY